MSQSLDSLKENKKVKEEKFSPSFLPTLLDIGVPGSLAFRLWDYGLVNFTLEPGVAPSAPGL